MPGVVSALSVQSVTQRRRNSNCVHCVLVCAVRDQSWNCALTRCLLADLVRIVANQLSLAPGSSIVLYLRGRECPHTFHSVIENVAK